MPVAITRRDLSVGELRREAAGTRDAKAARRMLAIAFVLEGQSRQDAAAICGMDRQTLRDWVHHYNADGLAGLVNRVRRNGSRPHLSPEQEAVVVEWVKQGPDLARVGRPPARAHGGQARQSKCFARAAQTHIPVLVGASAAPEQRPGGAGAFQREFAGLVTASLPATAAGKPIEVWFMDEARVGQQGTLTRVWAPRGTRPRALRDHRRNRTSMSRP